MGLVINESLNWVKKRFSLKQSTVFFGVHIIQLYLTLLIGSIYFSASLGPICSITTKIEKCCFFGGDVGKYFIYHSLETPV